MQIRIKLLLTSTLLLTLMGGRAYIPPATRPPTLSAGSSVAGISTWPWVYRAAPLMRAWRRYPCNRMLKTETMHNGRRRSGSSAFQARSLSPFTTCSSTATNVCIRRSGQQSAAISLTTRAAGGHGVPCLHTLLIGHGSACIMIL